MYVGGKLLANKTPDKTTSRGEPKLVLCFLVPKNECFALMLVDSLIRFGWAQSIVIHWPGLCRQMFTPSHNVTKGFPFYGVTLTSTYF